MRTVEKKFRIEKREISFLKYILEGWEGLAVISTSDAAAGIITLRISPDCVKDVDIILEELRRKMMIEAIPS